MLGKSSQVRLLDARFRTGSNDGCTAFTPARAHEHSGPGSVGSRQKKKGHVPQLSCPPELLLLLLLLLLLPELPSAGSGSLRR